MGVISPYGYSDIEFKELQKLNAKVDLIIASREPGKIHQNTNGTFLIKSKDNMVWWSKIDKAARYLLTLSIDDDEVAIFDSGRDVRYHVFEELPKGIRYAVKVVAEDRDGNEIISASIIL